ncbi:hypothetical protein BDV96DRAFT_600707 [Lophiotrema nucula]|uniref:Uncharacterized protein n=1 Tax=Lophiotrema nucula TaxID=690887 RepID=A0A6A5Z4Y6_9PLEO|nr:hypothetical protein BDV96DRAFT_600707 [Lophiotrema nucula]
MKPDQVAARLKKMRERERAITNPLFRVAPPSTVFWKPDLQRQRPTSLPTASVLLLSSSSCIPDLTATAFPGSLRALACCCGAGDLRDTSQLPTCVLGKRVSNRSILVSDTSKPSLPPIERTSQPPLSDGAAADRLLKFCGTAYILLPTAKRLWIEVRENLQKAHRGTVQVAEASKEIRLDIDASVGPAGGDTDWLQTQLIDVGILAHCWKRGGAQASSKLGAWRKPSHYGSRNCCFLPQRLPHFLHAATMSARGLLATVTAFLTSWVSFAGYEWNHSESSPLRSSPDTSSSMYPERPIRPLPKRRLRARLSPEQAESIVFPPAPQSTVPLFQFPYPNSERVQVRRGETDHHACHCGHNHSEVESEEEEDERAGLPSSPSYHYARNGTGKATTAGASAYRKPGSTASSADGYESFENTNNKKKRKIPNMGSMSTHHTNLAAEMASMGISQAHETAVHEDGDGPGRYYGSAPSTPQHATPGTGISGAGRGRFGRPVSGRSERRVLGVSNNLGNAKASSKRPPDQAGIISTAIANAQSAPPPPGNENVSLLQQEASKTNSAQQFTFTCGSDSASKMAWPGGQGNTQYPAPPGAYPADHRPPPPPTKVPYPAPVQNAPRVATHGTQTSPNMNGTAHPPAAKGAPAQKGAQQPPPPPKPRRSASKLYAYAARKRRMQQEYTNYQNPPKEHWICEFCEYESIFGTPPVALIRQYEIKDRKERKRLAEKRRLLEKARMKGRKGKKASKKAQNNAANNQNNQNLPAGDYEGHPSGGALDGQEEDYYDDDYDDVPPQPPNDGKPCNHPGCHHHPPPSKSQGQPPGDPRGGYRAPTNGA